MKKTHAIINLRASRAKAQSKTVEKLLKQDPLNVEKIHLIKNVKEIEKIYRLVLKDNPDLLIIGGGDGTIIRTIDWFNNNGYAKKFGIIPLGTSNYLARNLEIPLSPSAAVRKLRSKKAKTIQFATANEKLFSLMATIGLLTRISKHVKVKNKRRFGQIAYISEGIRQLMHHDSFSYEMTINSSNKKITGRAFQIVAFNADLNRQLSLAPTSDITKPWLKLSIYREESNTLIVLLNILIYVLSLRKIRRGIKTYKANRFNIKTKPTMEVSLDGEVSAKTPLSISGGRKKAKIIL